MTQADLEISSSQDYKSATRLGLHLILSSHYTFPAIWSLILFLNWVGFRKYIYHVGLKFFRNNRKFLFLSTQLSSL